MRTFFVDAANGRDARDGRAPDRAWKSLARVRRQRLHPGDEVRLRRGALWTEPLRLSGSGRPGRPIRIGAYGAGPRPRIAVRNVPVVANDGPVSWWRVTQLDVCGAAPWSPWGAHPEGQPGILFRANRPCVGLSVEDCVVHDVAGAGIVLHAGDAPGVVFDRWTVAGCEVYHAGTGITCGGPWPPGANPWRFHARFAVRDTVTHDIATDGIVLSHCRDGVIERCVAWRTGIGRTRRTPVGIWYFQALRCVIQHCESFDNHTAGGKADGGGFDLDGGAVDCTMQYNYSHDNDGAGFLICSYDPANAPCTGCVTRFNLSVNDGRANDYASIFFWQADRCRTYNNTCVTRISSPLKFTSATAGHLIANNLFVADARGDVPLVRSKFAVHDNAFRHNVWWRTGGPARFEIRAQRALDFAGFETLVRGAGERLVDPRLTTLAGREIRLPARSPLGRAGLRIAGAGGRDLDGASLPRTGPFPVGCRVV